MAKIVSIMGVQNIFEGLLSGTLGDKVYYIKNGKQYKRARPVFNKLKSKSEAQLDQWARFTAVMKFLKPLTIFLRVGFKNDQSPMSPFNAAMSFNFKNALTGTYPHYELAYPKVRVSQGTLPGALNPQVQLTLRDQVEYTWEDNSFEINSKGDDKALLVVYNSIKQLAVFTVDGNARYNRRQVLALPSTFEGDEVHCYIAFQNQRQTVCSNSQYLGELRIARI